MSNQFILDHIIQNKIPYMILSNILGSFTISTNYCNAVRILETLLLLPLFVDVCVGPLFSNFVLGALYRSVIILLRKRASL